MYVLIKRIESTNELHNYCRDVKHHNGTKGTKGTNMNFCLIALEALEVREVREVQDSNSRTSIIGTSTMHLAGLASIVIVRPRVVLPISIARFYNGVDIVHELTEENQ